MLRRGAVIIFCVHRESGLLRADSAWMVKSPLSTEVEITVGFRVPSALRIPSVRLSSAQIQVVPRCVRPVAGTCVFILLLNPG